MKTFFLSILSFNWWRMLDNILLASAMQQSKSAIIIINHLLFEPPPLIPSYPSRSSQSASLDSLSFSNFSPATYFVQGGNTDADIENRLGNTVREEEC